MSYSRLIAYGSYLPSECRSNADIAKTLDTSDEWITKRTGIKIRHIAVDEKTSDLASKALINAMNAFSVDPESLDGIIVATTTPDITFPSVAAFVHGKVLNTSSAFSFDINAVCCGFIYALIMADSLIKSGAAKRIAVIGAETMSSILDWTDRSTCVLFGDGAGAFILEKSETPGILAHNFHSNGKYVDLLKAEQSNGVHMDGREVFKQAVEKMVESSLDTLNKAGMTVDDVDWLLPHQANQRILVAVADKLGISEEKLVSTISKHANTSAASIPLAFTEYAKSNRIKAGDTILMPAVGGGLTWGSVLIKFDI